MSIFSIFIIELLAFRWGTAKLAALGITHDPHGHGVSQDGIGTHAAHGPEPDKDRAAGGSPDLSEQEITVVEKDIEAGLSTPKTLSQDHGHEHHHHAHGPIDESAAAQIIGIAILEFGVVLHR